MAAGTNSVGVFFSDRNYEHLLWPDLIELNDPRLFVLVQVLHHQSTDLTRPPNRVLLNGRDVTSMLYKPQQDALVVRSIEYAGLLGNSVMKESTFWGPDAPPPKKRTQRIEFAMDDWDIESALSGQTKHSEYAWINLDYDELGADAVAHSLRAEAAPSSGTF